MSTPSDQREAQRRMDAAIAKAPVRHMSNAKWRKLFAVLAAMSWGDLSWLADHGYEKSQERDDYHREAWVLRGRATRRVKRTWREVVITWTGDDEAQEYVEVSAGLLDDNLCFVHVSIDNVKFDDLRQRLEWYERRVLQMLQVGLDSAADGGVA